LAVEARDLLTQAGQVQAGGFLCGSALCTGPPAEAQAGRFFRSQPSMRKLKDQLPRGSRDQ
jgi:hypothetical protein